MGPGADHKAALHDVLLATGSTLTVMVPTAMRSVPHVDQASSLILTSPSVKEQSALTTCCGIQMREHALSVQLKMEFVRLVTAVAAPAVLLILLCSPATSSA